MASAPNHARLLVVGTPLSDTGLISAEARLAIEGADLIIAESKKNAFRYLKQADRKTDTPIYFLDPPRKDEQEAMICAVEHLASVGGTAVLLSDTGMPILFDPGVEILNLAKKLDFQIRSVPSATSWGTACALSGFLPPFLIVGFLSREMEERKQELLKLRTNPGHLVLMDTPYRFEVLLKQCAEVLGANRKGFLAWEISKSEEQLYWGSLKELIQKAQAQGLKKGEFVLIIDSQIRVK